MILKRHGSNHVPYFKHIDIKYFHIRELVENKELELHSINTEENTSDIFTQMTEEIFARYNTPDVSI